MKKIINKTNSAYTFHCTECGCDFKSDEYRIVEFNYSYFMLGDLCPNCKKSVYKVVDSINEIKRKLKEL